jgi:osmotically-inducible protein OsmY
MQGAEMLEREPCMKISILGALALGMSLSPCWAMGAESVATSQVAPEKDPKLAAAAVTQALRSSREVDASRISVTTHASAVVISGSVADEAAAARARAIAEKAADGVRISANLEVDPPSADAAGSASRALARDVEAALHRDARTSKLQVTVSSDVQQTIGLHGLVPSAADRTAAHAVAAQVKGVKKVQNSLVTSGSD